MGVKVASFSAGAVALSAGLALTYSRPWAAITKDTGDNIAANSPYFDATGVYVGPFSKTDVATYVGTGGASNALPTAGLFHVGGTWIDGTGAYVYYNKSADSSLSYVAIHTEANLPSSAGDWSDASILARVGVANRTIACSYQGGDALANGRTSGAARVSLLRNATAAQGESATESFFPFLPAVTNGVPIMYCKVLDTSGNELAHAVCAWAENMSPTGPYAAAVAAAQANTNNKWILLGRYANMSGGTAAWSNGAAGLNATSGWQNTAPDEMWFATCDYRAALSDQGNHVGLCRAVKVGNLWEVKPLILLWSEPAGSTWSVHMQGVVVVKAGDGAIGVLATRQQMTSNLIQITRTDPSNYDEGASWFAPTAITGGSTTTVTVTCTQAQADDLAARLAYHTTNNYGGLWLNVCGNAGSGTSKPRRVTATSFASGTLTVTFADTTAGAATATGYLCGCAVGSANWPWHAITGGNQGSKQFTFAGDASQAAVYASGATINVRGNSSKAVVPGDQTVLSLYDPVNDNYPLSLAGSHSAGTVTLTTSATVGGTLQSNKGHVSRNLILNNTANGNKKQGWFVDQCCDGVPQDLANAAGVTSKAVVSANSGQRYMRHMGYLSGTSIAADSSVVNMGSDEPGGLGVRITMPANSETTRPLIEQMNARFSKTSKNLNWSIYRNTTYWWSFIAPVADTTNVAGANCEKRLCVSVDGFNWGDLVQCDSGVLVGSKVVIIRGNTLSIGALPVVYNTKGLLTSWTGPNYALPENSNVENADAGWTKTYNISRATQAALNSALGYTVTVTLPPTGAPIARFYSTYNAVPTSATQFLGRTSITQASAGAQTTKYANLAVPVGPFKLKGWTYTPRPNPDRSVDFKQGPYNCSQQYMTARFVHSAGNGSGDSGTIFLNNYNGTVNAQGWTPWFKDFDTTDENSGFINGTGLSGTFLINCQIAHGYTHPGYLEQLFVCSEVLSGASGGADFPAVPLPLATSASAPSGPKPAEKMTVRVGGFTPSATWLCVAAGVIPKDSWEYADRTHLRPTTRRFFTLRQSTTREIRVIFNPDDRRFTFTDGTNTTTVDSPFAGSAFTGATATNTVGTYPAAPSFTLTGGTIPNSSAGDLSGWTIFITSGGAATTSVPGKIYTNSTTLNAATMYRTAKIRLHSGTTLTLDRPIAANATGSIAATINSTGGEFCPMQGSPVTIAVYADGNNYKFVVSCNGVTNSATATWSVLETDNTENIRPSEWIGMDSDEGNADAVAWAKVVMDDAAAAGLSVANIVTKMNELTARNPEPSAKRVVIAE